MQFVPGLAPAYSTGFSGLLHKLQTLSTLAKVSQHGTRGWGALDKWATPWLWSSCMEKALNWTPKILSFNPGS